MTKTQRAKIKSAVQIYKGEDLDKMRRVCQLAAATLIYLEDKIVPGMSTADIDRLVLDFTLKHGAYPAPLNYPDQQTDPRNPVITDRSFPASVCTSVNEVVCHGIPSEDVILREGDLVNIDVTPCLDGFHGDTSRTFMVGDVSPEARRLVEVTKKCLEIGIQQVKRRSYTGEIGNAIHEYARSQGMGVVRDYCGHGVGRIFHSGPSIAHFRTEDRGERMLTGMCFTIEPMINLGSYETESDEEDHWTVRTKDGSLSAQFEHTVVVTRQGCEVLTDPETARKGEFA